MITNLLGFERIALMEISNAIIEDCATIPELEYDKNASSPVWEKVFKAFPAAKGVNSEAASTDFKKELYENFSKMGFRMELARA